MLQMIVVGSLDLFQQFRQLHYSAWLADMHVLWQQNGGSRIFTDGTFICLKRGKTAADKLVFYQLLRPGAFCHPIMIKVYVKIRTGGSLCAAVHQVGIQDEHITGLQRIFAAPFLQIHFP